jgi:two-component system chemotaxis response regulator CheY
MNAMVVDDSRAMRMILTRTLTELGFQVSQAGSGNEALALMDGNAGLPALMLVDWNMPGMDGLELVQRIRADAAANSTTLVMVTTETEIAQMATALEAGANEYIMKPFTREVIADKLRLLGLVE